MGLCVLALDGFDGAVIGEAWLQIQYIPWGEAGDRVDTQRLLVTSHSILSFGLHTNHTLFPTISAQNIWRLPLNISSDFDRLSCTYVQVLEISGCASGTIDTE
jgi:hypothetical protein